MQFLISDSNIFIDMEVSNLTQKMFELPYQFGVPDILYYEELEEEHHNLLEYGLKTKKLSSNSIKYSQKIIKKYPKTSPNDLFALALAKQDSCPLITGDLELRKAGAKEEVIVLGTIWLVEELINHSIITIDEAREAYTLMKENERRLPWSIIEERFNSFQPIEI